MKTPFVQSHVFDSGKPGPSLLVLGALHGNGTAGTIALNELMQELRQKRVTLLCGRLTLVPVANPAAYARGQRLVHANLNRLFTPNPAPRNDEERAAAEIMPLIDACDVLLDIHSCHRLDKPFAFLDYDTPANRRLAAALGLAYVCTGWNDVYKSDGIFAPGPYDYAHSKGKTCGFAECGWEDEPAAVAAARGSLRNALEHLGLVVRRGNVLKPEVREFRYERRVVREAGGGFARDWTHFDSVRKGGLIATYSDGREFRAEYDGCILFPTPDAVVGEAWFYVGRDVGIFMAA
jgi:predicted deacylase